MHRGVCPCCRRPFRLGGASIDTGAPGRSRRLCTHCSQHQGSTGLMMQRRDQDHVSLWERMWGQHEEELRGSQAKIEALRRELAEEIAQRPERVVVKHVDLDRLQEAEGRADRAYRARDSAFRALTEVRLLHREERGGLCRCGTRADRCELALIVDRYPALADWERRQVQRLRDYDTHELPDNHPAVLDRRRRPA